jgi:perosamine synthetase
MKIPSTDDPIPIYASSFGADDVEALTRCLEPERFDSAAPIAEFEQAFAKTIAAPHAIAVANGTVALHLAMLACGIGPGDEVILPALTFIATANAATYVGATPIFADVESTSWQMTAEEAARHITPRTRAILTVHLYGHARDMRDMRALANAHGLWLIEDCAEALGTTIGGRHVGLDSDIATFSFYKNKTITTGEGGMVFTRHSEWHEKITLLKGQGVPLQRRYSHEILGYNYRMDNLSASLGTAQLRKFETILANKRYLADRYRSALAGVPFALQCEPTGTQSSWWLVAGTVDSPETRDGLAAHLASHGIETRPAFRPVQRYPMYSTSNALTPQSDRIGNCGLCLPSGPWMADEQIDRVGFEVRRFFDR